MNKFFAKLGLLAIVAASVAMFSCKNAADDDSDETSSWSKKHKGAAKITGTSKEVKSALSQVSQGEYVVEIIDNYTLEDLRVALQDDRLKVHLDLSRMTLLGIAEGAFYCCNSLASVNLPDGVTEIGTCAFSGCESLSDIVLPDSVVKIDSGAFSGCNLLSELTIPASVKEISPSLLEFTYGNYNYGSQSLSRINVDEKNENYKSVDGVLYSKDGKTLVCYPTGKDGSNWAIPDGVEAIQSFSRCQLLPADLTIPASVKELCRLPQCVRNVQISDLAKWCEISDSPLYYGADLYLNGEKLTNLVIPDGAESVGNAFQGCQSIESVTIPDGAAMHFVCDGYSHDVGWFSKFSNLPSLSIISFGDCVTFSKNTGMFGHSPPERHPTICFNFENSLKTVTFKMCDPQVAFEGCYVDINAANLETIFVPAGTLDAYKDVFKYAGYAGFPEPEDEPNLNLQEKLVELN